MAEGVTYADLRFAKKSPPEKTSRPPPDAPEEAGDDGELTYENFAAARAPQPDGSPGQPQAPGPARRRLWPAALLLGAGLFLLATCIGLGVRYWQVSRQLEGASQRHRAQNSAQAQTIGSQAETLSRTQRKLDQARAELDATKLDLRQSWQTGNSTQQQLKEEQSRRALLQQEKDEALKETTSCQRIGCCPSGWQLFRWRCLLALWDRRTWEQSRQACGQMQAQLLVLRPWDDDSLWDAAAIRSHLQSGEFWIGLRWNGGWHWVDGTRYTGSKKLDLYHRNCVKMRPRTLEQEYCDAVLQGYVCEKAATPSPP